MKYKVIVFDVDGTVTKHDNSWRYIHERLGTWDDQASLHQELFLSGKISYKEFCERDAAHWKGLPEKNIREMFDSIDYCKNAPRYVKKLKKAGFKIAAVSSGLQFLARRLRKELGFDFITCNRLLTQKGIFTGKVQINVAHGKKARVLRRVVKEFRIKAQEVIAVGDSAGDIDLARRAGYAIAFNASDEELISIVDYNCRTNDFREVFDRIMLVAR